jgi:SEFIR domain-containing protein
MTAEIPKVFVSYAHESDEHKAQVLAFATFLRRAGIEAVLDLWSANARQDWYSWAIKEMTDADHVLVVASARYRMTGDGTNPSAEHRGVQSEAALLRELVYADRATWLPKTLPVVLPGHAVDEIPLFLQPHTASRFHITSFDAAGSEELLRVLLRQPGYVAPEVSAEQPVLPPHPDVDLGPPVARPADRPRVTNQITGTVTGNVVQADTITGNITF